MSLKSFDKFCENMIMSEPGSQKEVFDERQNQVRANLFIESLLICILLSFLLVAINETPLRWCEECTPLMMLSVSVCWLWNVIRCAAKDCLFGVKGSGTVGMALIIAINCTHIFVRYSPDGEEPFVINDGLVSTEFIMLISAFVMFASFIVVVALNSRRKKRQSADKENN